ncbi:hypothetical protein Mpt1_c07460 [Candidatus Methanoplasma termitum]|uniref:Uncharacterized protein n=1 Tax=Candidatus Methanoplasma termitum TaxID=1577791 RepID=A0A0A7LC57_9ARCH|nr:hypothetical protein [Candidatus Methanoplasma termitum]AIZ56629.1 hypothetical protein Mpt1_c07460 [Candidatus Methanoplasma termitum]
MNIGDNDEEQKTSSMSFSESNLYVGPKMYSHFNQETVAGDFFINSEGKEETEEFSEEEMPETLRDVFGDVLISMMGIMLQNAAQCNPEKCEKDCDTCEIRPVPKIICIGDKVIRTNGRTNVLPLIPIMQKKRVADKDQQTYQRNARYNKF